MPGIGPRRSLQRVVGGKGRRFFLIEVEEVGISRPRNVSATIEAANGTVGIDRPGAGRTTIIGGDLRLARLVDVAEAEQPCPFRSDVCQLYGALVAYSLLNVNVPVLHVRRTDVGIDAEEAPQRRRVAKHRHAGSNGGSRCAQEGDGSRADPRVRRTWTERAVVGQVRQEHVL